MADDSTFTLPSGARAKRLAAARGAGHSYEVFNGENSIVLSDKDLTTLFSIHIRRVAVGQLVRQLTDDHAAAALAARIG